MMYKLYFLLKRIEKQTQNSKFIKKYIKYMLDLIEVYFNVIKLNFYKKCFWNKKGVNTKGKRKQNIIVSLTTYPKRISTIWITIETLLRQSVKPDKIILWLARDEFSSIEELPEHLKIQMKRGLEIRFCDNLRSHKKYFYVMQEYPEDIVILVDDDMFYPYDTIKKLLKLHNKYPKDICCMTGQVMEKKGNKNKPSLWRNPEVREQLKHSDHVQIFTGSGSLYPPYSLDNTAFDKEKIQKLCPYADDLWLTMMAHRHGTKVTTYYPWRAFPISIYGTGENSLWYINSQDGQNDVQWKNMEDFFENNRG